MESLLHAAASHVALVLQAVAIVVVAFGSVRALLAIARRLAVPQATGGAPREVWLDYAHWLVAALTFQLGADIVSSSFTPTWEELGRLAVVAAIRTFLSYFLDREVERAAQSSRSAGPGAPAAAPRRAD